MRYFYRIAGVIIIATSIAVALSPVIVQCGVWGMVALGLSIVGVGVGVRYFNPWLDDTTGTLR